MNSSDNFPRVDIELTPGDPSNVATVAVMKADHDLDVPAMVTLTADGPVSREQFSALLAGLTEAAVTAWGVAGR